MRKPVVQGIYIAAIRMVENNEYLRMINRVIFDCYETEFEFRSLMAWGKKLIQIPCIV